MKVSDLQEILANVGRLFNSAGGKGAAELSLFRESLEPFRDLTAKQFASEILKLIEDRPTKRKPSGKTATAAALDVDLVVREIQDLYARAADPSVTVEQVEESANRLAALAKNDLVGVAERIELVGMGNKNKNAIVAAIRQRILSRKGSAQKVTRIERSPFANNETSHQ